MNITILGCGAYGVALSCMFRKNNCKIRMWNKFDDVFPELRKKYNDIYFTNNMEDSLINSEIIVVAIPIAFLGDVSFELKNYYKGQDILIASKGIGTDNGLFASEIIKKYINTDNIGVISGGTFAVDMENMKVMGITLGTKSNSVKEKVKRSLQNKFLKVQYIDDILGVQLCGAIKNVIAIGFGILDGASYPESSRFLFLTEAIYEIDNLIKSLGGSGKTIMSYAGIDDIMMTCTSSKSRNYTFGKLIGSNSNKEEIDDYKNNTTVEGLGTAMGIEILCKNNNLNLGICSIIFDILYNDKDYMELIRFLENKD